MAGCLVYSVGQVRDGEGGIKLVPPFLFGLVGVSGADEVVKIQGLVLKPAVLGVPVVPGILGIIGVGACDSLGGFNVQPECEVGEEVFGGDFVEGLHGVEVDAAGETLVGDR